MAGDFVMNRQALHSDMKRPGQILIELNEQGQVVCLVSGFEFDEQASCRENLIKALAWGFDVLETAVKSNMLVPGGVIVVAAD